MHCFHVHPYVRVLDGQAFTFFMRFVTDHAEVWCDEPRRQHHRQYDDDGCPSTSGTESAITADAPPAWSTQVEQGIVFGAAGVWPMVITEDEEGAFDLVALGTFDIRIRSPFDLEP